MRDVVGAKAAGLRIVTCQPRVTTHPERTRRIGDNAVNDVAREALCPPKDLEMYAIDACRISQHFRQTNALQLPRRTLGNFTDD